MSYAKRINVHRLATGGTVLVSAFPSHGMVSIVGSVAGGARLAGNDSLADAHAAMLLEGTTKRTKAELQVALDTMGASLSFAIERDRLTFTAHVRDIHLKKLLALINETLSVPSFSTRELAYYKERTVAELSLEGQDTRAQASINLSRLLFDPSHPNYQLSTQESLAELALVTRTDLITYHARAIDRDSLVVSVSSDVPATDLVAVIERSFARLPRHHTSLPTYVAATPQAAKKIAVPIAGKASIDYMIGVASGITKDHADYPPLLLGMQVLGAPGLVSRLTQAVREEEGLTYDVRAVLDGFNGADGSCIISATFAPTLYEQGKASIMRQVRKILDENISAAEVRKYAQMYEARTRVFSSNSGSIARTAHQVTIEGRSPSYLDEFPKKILKLTPREVHAALKKYLVIDDLSESAAGPVAKQ